MKSKQKPKPRNTIGKRVAKLATPEARVRALLDERKPKKHIRPDADLLVGKWQGVLALVALDEKCNEESAEVEREISAVGRDSLNALADAFGKWDADFFEHVAHAMRHAASARPYDKRRILADYSIITGEKPSDVAKRLTAGQPNANLESELRQVRRYLKQVRWADK